MSKAQSFAAHMLLAGRAVVAAGLCMLLAEQPLLAEAAVRVAPVNHRAPAKAAEIQGQARVLHALNRFTFGPRPGDVAAVQAMGLDRWFEMQLNPASVDDVKLEARLAEFPAMNMPVAQLAERYPGPQMIRAYADGKLPLPADPQQRAVVETQIALAEMKKENKAGEASAGGNGADPKLQPQVSAADQPAIADQAPFPQVEVQRIVMLPPDARVQALLALPPQDLVRFRKSLKPRETEALTAGLTPQQRELLTSLQGSERMVAQEAMETRMLRDVYSERQLEAVMTDFWLNHFNVYLHKNQQEPYLIPTYERETIRAHALGRFEDLLVATAESPAMLVYLDNFRSIGPDSLAATRAKQRAEANPNGKIAKKADEGLNENYGRELMELHTLGVNGAGYTQKDVTEVAKVFTGWGIARPQRPGAGDGDGGTFEFDERRHEPGPKTVLGHVIRENGVNEGLEVLHLLATNPATAHFLCEKLAVRFVSDTPPPALVDRMAKSYLASNGDIKTVLRTMWRSPEFWSPAVYRAKVKTPEEFLISAVRASDAEVVQAQPLVAALDRLGQPFYGMQTPNGYAWIQDDWVSTGALVNRMNLALVLSGNRVPGTRTAWDQLIAGPSGTAAGMVNASYDPGVPKVETPEAKEQKLEEVLLGERVSERTRSTVLGQANDENVTSQAATQFDLRPQGKGAKAAPPRGLLRGGQQQPDDPQAAVMAGLLLGSPEFQRR